jgi:hypothetical protein
MGQFLSAITPEPSDIPTDLVVTIAGPVSSKERGVASPASVVAGRQVAVDEQPMPTPRPTLPDVWVLVQQDMQARSDAGYHRYGSRLRPFNGRVPLVDAYQEALDLAVYLRQRIWEDENEPA